MISNLDIWRAAQVMLKHYGDKMMNGGRRIVQGRFRTCALGYGASGKRAKSERSA